MTISIPTFVHFVEGLGSVFRTQRATAIIASALIVRRVLINGSLFCIPLSIPVTPVVPTSTGIVPLATSPAPVVVSASLVGTSVPVVVPGSPWVATCGWIRLDTSLFIKERIGWLRAVAFPDVNDAILYHMRRWWVK